jgi:hypothetical protein
MQERLKNSRSNWQNRNLPHPMSPQWGGSFYLGRLGPGETSPVTWGFERAKANSTKTNFPLTDYRQSDSPAKGQFEVTPKENVPAWNKTTTRKIYASYVQWG